MSNPLKSCFPNPPCFWLSEHAFYFDKRLRYTEGKTYWRMNHYSFQNLWIPLKIFRYCYLFGQDMAFGNAVSSVKICQFRRNYFLNIKIHRHYIFHKYPQYTRRQDQFVFLCHIVIPSFSYLEKSDMVLQYRPLLQVQFLPLLESVHEVLCVVLTVAGYFLFPGPSRVWLNYSLLLELASFLQFSVNILESRWYVTCCISLFYSEHTYMLIITVSYF